MSITTKRTRCRSCLSSDLRIVVDFGPQPLAGFYATTSQEALDHERYPLILEMCSICALLQITDLPPIGEVFHDDYAYSSSQIAPLVEHFAGYARWLAERLPTDATILEFGCNDGVLLNQLHKLGFGRLTGIDASPNMAAVAVSRGFDVLQGFFGGQIISPLDERAPFDLITCSNVFAHIDDLQDVLAAAHRLLGEAGQLCIEVHDAEKLILEGQFETVYHEHLTYFSASSLRTCLRLNGFEVVEIEKTRMHGGGLRTLARKAPKGACLAPAMTRSAAEIDSIGASICMKIATCRDKIISLQTEYDLLDGYGVAGRAQMFLSMTHSEAAFGQLYDDAPIRQGRYAVGTDIRIMPFSPEGVAKTCVILAWNYADEIMKRIEPHYENIFVMFPQIAKLK